MTVTLSWSMVGCRRETIDVNRLDLAQSLPGVLKLRAFRLTSEYLAANKEGSFTSAA